MKLAVWNCLDNHPIVRGHLSFLNAEKVDVFFLLVRNKKWMRRV
jgi:hypothetical protein